MKNRGKSILLVILILSSLPLIGQQASELIAGSWLGVLKAGAVELRLVFNISVKEDRSLQATLDSPDQGAMGIPMGKVSLTQDSIRIEAPVVNGFYVGQILSGSGIRGEWHQSGQSFKVDLERQGKALAIKRPQEPGAPFPYKEEEVSFLNADQGFSLGGTLTIPEGQGPFPAAILVTGSGSQNRNEEIFGHKPFQVIADHLTRNGIAVLRYDDRGVGSSGGSAVGSTTRDLAVDAWSAFDYLKIRSEIDHAKTGIIGHSEGGMIAFMLAASHQDIAYIVSLAGPGVDGKTILLDQSDRIARLSGAGNAILEDNWKVMSGVYDIMIANESYEDWKEETMEFTTAFYTEKLLQPYREEDIEQLKSQLLSSVSEASYPWMRYFVMSDPAPLFESIKCPVLALNGELDCQVLPAPNIEAIKNGLLIAGNSATKTMILPGLNHLFQNSETGLPGEYGSIEETFDPNTLVIISDWILDQVD